MSAADTSRDDDLPRPRDLGALAWAVVALLATQIVGALLLSLSIFVRTFVAHSDALWEIENALVIPDQALFFLTAFVFAIWFYLAHQNLRRLGADPEHASGFAIGAWLIPIGNLWFPYQVAADIWRSSAGPPSDDDAVLRRERGVGLVGLWWALYIGMNVSSTIAGFLVTNVSTASFELANGMMTFAHLVSVAAAVCAIRVVLGITQRQRDSAATSPAPVVF